MAKNYHKRTPRGESLPERLPADEGQKLVEVYVEGYDDVAFWRGVFNDFESERVTFDISVPPRPDLAKGKRVLIDMIGESSPTKLLCVDSDFDWLFGGGTSTSKQVLEAPYLFHTYTYATENYLCWAPALHTVCTKATKNDTRIFDFERFLTAYSRIIYPAFIWYAYSASQGSEHIFKLIDFKNTVRIHYLELAEGGEATLGWLRSNVARKVRRLEQDYPDHLAAMRDFKAATRRQGVDPDSAYLFMHGHTLLDNVVMPALSVVCDKLKQLANDRIERSAQRGVAFVGETNNYRNALLNVRDTLIYNEEYKGCFLYRRLHADIREMLGREGML